MTFTIDNGLTDEERAAIRADILALPPLTDDQIDDAADTLFAIERRWTGGRNVA